MTRRFEGSVAVVTGAGRGMGRAVALRFAGEGAHVVVAELNPEHGAEVAEEIRAAGGTAASVAVDVSRTEDVARLFDEAVRVYGVVDILVNNAGIAVARPILDYTEADWDRQMGVNVKGGARSSISRRRRPLSPRLTPRWPTTRAKARSGK